MSKVMRLGYVHLRVTDLEESRNHYSNTLGMEVVASEPGKLYLKCWDEWDHHSLVLEEGGVGLVKLGYKEAQLAGFWGGNALRVLKAAHEARKAAT
jgi:catechol 2,3-dioxygenase-like lactoylglutathione lyase family enzyme